MLGGAGDARGIIPRAVEAVFEQTERLATQVCMLACVEGLLLVLVIAACASHFDQHLFPGMGHTTHCRDG